MGLPAGRRLIICCMSFSAACILTLVSVSRGLLPLWFLQLVELVYSIIGLWSQNIFDFNISFGAVWGTLWWWTIIHSWKNPWKKADISSSTGDQLVVIAPSGLCCAPCCIGITANEVSLSCCQLTLTLVAVPTPNNQRYICEFGGSSVWSSMATHDVNANTLTVSCPAAVPDRALFTGQGSTW